jgi:Domain of unknown function (DUF4292)
MTTHIPLKPITYCALLALSIGFFCSCKTTRKIQTAISKKDTTAVVVTGPAKIDSAMEIRHLLQKVEQNRINYTTFSCNVKVDYEDGEGKSRDFNAFVRMQKDSVIWIRINIALGFEGFRALITPDSVKLINKLDKVIQFRSLDYLQEVTQIPFDFSTLQDLLIGNPVYLASSLVSYTKRENEVSLLALGEIFKHLITLSSSDYTILHSKLDDADVVRNRTCDLTYNDYETKNGIRFSTNRRITLAEKSKLDIKLNFKQYGFNEILTFPFTLPKNYKRK